MPRLKEPPFEKVTEKTSHGTTIITRREYTHKLVFERFTLSQRLQHIVLMLSFIILIITGLPLLTPSSSIVKAIFYFPGSFELRGLIHRVAAALLILLSLYHILYSLLSGRGSTDMRKMIFGRKDIRDFKNYLRYNLGRSPEKPRFDRFNFIEKFEYFSVAWGTTIMILTGLILWQEEAAMVIFPKWVLDVATAIHGYEAILAFLAIIIWHLYTVHLNPDFFPMNRVWLTGTLTEDEMKKHHPLEYEEIMKSPRS